MLIQGPIGRLAIDNNGRLKAVLENSAVLQSGTWVMPTYSNGNIIFQLANIEYDQAQRSKFTFV
jgi:hypothetical protein